MKRRKSALLARTVIDSPDFIEMSRTGKGNINVNVSFFENGKQKMIVFKIGRGDLGCIAEQTRTVLRQLREDLNHTIARVEGKV